MSSGMACVAFPEAASIYYRWPKWDRRRARIFRYVAEFLMFFMMYKHLILKRFVVNSELIHFRSTISHDLRSSRSLRRAPS